MNNSIAYSREMKISYDVINFQIKDIPVLKKEKLSIYQKYIILLLNNGIVASSKEELINNISIALNIKKSFVYHFIANLTALKYIEYNQYTKKFTLSNSYKIIYDNDDNTIMKANTGKANAEYKNLYYIQAFNKVVSIDFFNNDSVSLKRMTKKIDKNFFQELDKKIKEEQNVKKIKKIVKEFFEKDEILLSKDFKYTLVDKFETYRVDLDVVLFYEYNDGISKLNKIQCNPTLELSQEIFNDIKEKYDIDTNIPRFIELKETFYDALDKNIEKLEELDTRYNKENKELEYCQLELAKERTKLKDLENNEVENSLEITEIKDDISVKEKECEHISSNLAKTTKEKEDAIKESQIIINIGNDKMHPLINKVLNKYKSDSRIERKIRKICPHIDKLLSANECNAVDEFEDIIQQIRNLNNTALKMFFDCIFKKTPEKLFYYFDIKNLNEVQKTLEKKNISYELYMYMKRFHGICNPYGHPEESLIGKDNKKEIEEFTKLDKKERENIILSPVHFFNDIKLTKDELKKLKNK